MQDASTVTRVAAAIDMARFLRLRCLSMKKKIEITVEGPADLDVRM